MTSTTMRRLWGGLCSVPAFCAALRHFGICSLIGMGVAFSALWAWFPPELLGLMGLGRLFGIFFVANVVAGSFLILLIFSPNKKRVFGVRFGIAVVLIFQIGFCAAGVCALYLGRPVAVVFEVDRFRVVTFSDVGGVFVGAAIRGEQFFEWKGVPVLGTRGPRSSVERLESIEKAIGGLDIGLRPAWWQAYGLSAAAVLVRARSYEELTSRHVDEVERIAKSARWASKSSGSATLAPTSLKWLPLVSRRADDWVVWVDPHTAMIRGCLHVDGF